MHNEPLTGLSAILADYDAILCDVWGVVHNGVDPYEGAGDALQRAREAGTPVVLLTNAPRPSFAVRAQLDDIGVPREAYDGIVTSGDAVRAFLSEAGYGSVYHLGPRRDHSLFDDLGIAVRHDAKGVDAIVATDLLERAHTPDRYREELARLVEMDLPFVCANPDLVVERGGEIIYCGGSLAKVYEEEGGTAMQFGKPHTPVYEMAREALEAAAGRPLERILAIGDGLPTDITGANRQGFDVLFVTNGIHVDDLGERGRPEPQKVSATLSDAGLVARAFLPDLVW